ncbi:hypothetical protein MRB53_003330 [Persea americana]|uniref:Uncharacterized protein n=1 Tax=Persea americana TaxID=3435 RepID=A0ACC2MWW9_PERAE|nr:hypothetical protein MRB53_003330 [Persea americana]
MARPSAYMDYSLQSRVWNEIFKAGLTPAIPPVSPSVHIWRRPNQSQRRRKVGQNPGNDILERERVVEISLRRSVFWRRFCGNFEELLLVLSGFGRWVLRCFEYLGLEVTG